MRITVDEFGPLPTGDRQDTLQQLSLRALRNRLPENKFLFRDERIDDKGVDVALEAKVEIRISQADGGEKTEEKFTNCRAQVQVKSTDKQRQNQDGSISYSIDTSNLNYLLNGSCPVYVLWTATTGELRFAWAREEWRRLDEEEIDWREKDSFTIRFRHILDDDAVRLIHERILGEARFERRLHENLSRASFSETVVVAVNPKSLTSTDPLELFAWITGSGMTLVASGFGSKVCDWFAVLNPEHRRNPRVNLILAYAFFTLGRNFEAEGAISTAALSLAILSPEDREFLSYLRDACAYQTGRIGHVEYLERQVERARQTTGIDALQYRLEQLRQDRLHSQDRSRRATLLDEMRAVAAKIEDSTEAKNAHKLNARIHVLSAEGEAVTGQFSEVFIQQLVRRDAGIAAPGIAQEGTAGVNQLWESWDEQARICINDAMKEGHPLLLADAISARMSVYQALLLTQRMHAETTGTPWRANATAVRVMMQEADHAGDIYKLAGHLEGETRCKLLLADLFDCLGHGEAAKGLAEGALGVARAMAYARLESHATDYLQNTTIIQKFKDRLAERGSVDEDIHVANESDDKVLSAATLKLASLKLPVERLPVLVREANSFRRIARERVDFCRYIELIHDQNHMKVRSTCYVNDPMRACICEKHGHRSVIEDADAEILIQAFKQAYCDSCPDRDPRNAS